MPYFLPLADIHCLNDLLRTRVRAETQRYNARHVRQDLLPAQMDGQSEKGKIAPSDPVVPPLCWIRPPSSSWRVAAGSFFPAYRDAAEAIMQPAYGYKGLSPLMKASEYSAICRSEMATFKQNEL